MRVASSTPRTRKGPFSESDDTLIARHYADGVSPAVTGQQLGRTGKAIEQRVYILRRMGVIAGYSPRRRAVEIDTRAVRLDPPLVLRGDDKLVAASLMAGGFPTAVQTRIGTIWAGPDGMPWRHGKPTVSLAA